MGGIFRRLLSGIDPDPFVGRVVPIHETPYAFRRRLGAGSFGAVYAGETPLRTPVAIKVININGLPQASLRIVKVYLNEVAMLERLRQESRHVVYIYDFDFDSHTGLAYIVMELGGDNLGKVIRTLHANSSGFGTAMSPSMIQDIWRQMVSIIYTLHSNGIVHMDLKPDNLIFFGSILKIADLGISRKVTALGVSGVGTPFFSAPEVMQDIAGLPRFYDTKTDIWSLGAILYFMLYGRPPIYSHLATNPPLGQPRYPNVLINDILRQTLVLNPLGRANIVDLIHHPFTTG